jgi:hypothetical protein
MAGEVNKIFGHQPCQMVKNYLSFKDHLEHHQGPMVGTDMVPETLLIF